MILLGMITRESLRWLTKSSKELWSRYGLKKIKKRIRSKNGSNFEPSQSFWAKKVSHLKVTCTWPRLLRWLFGNVLAISRPPRIKQSIWMKHSNYQDVLLINNSRENFSISVKILEIVDFNEFLEISFCL